MTSPSLASAAEPSLSHTGTAGLRAALVLVDDPLFLEHAAPPGHPERAERLLAVRRGVERAREVSGAQFAVRAARDATLGELSRVHADQYVEQLGHLAGRSGYLDADTFLSQGSVPAAFRAAGAALALVEALAQGESRFGLALARPPGHHALPDRAMGFCLLNNVAAAARHAQSLGFERIAIVDWDVHHGNGTQEMFYADPSVLFMSLHQFPMYPGTGDVEEIGEDDGRGRTVNVPLTSGATDGVYEAAFERIVLPILEQFAPGLVLVSSGFDAHARDPLAEMQLTESGFARMAESLTQAVSCPVGIVLEGGYDLTALEASTAAVTEALLGSGSGDTPRDRPLQSGRALAPMQQEQLERVLRCQSAYWKF